MATAHRRMGGTQSETRTRLLDLAEQLMRAEGYAAVTSRRLGREADLSPQIVYYYFRTMDDLFEALFSRVADFYAAAIEEVAAAAEPLLAMWALSCDRSRAVIISELMALANHRKGLQTLIADFGRSYHARQAGIVAEAMAAKGVDPDTWPPYVVAAVLENAARSFALGGDYGIEAHTKARDFVTERLKELLSPPKAGAAGRRSDGIPS